MRVQTLLLTILAATGCMQGGGVDGVDKTRAPIVNGTDDTGDPAVVEIATGCTGTLIAPRVVLTAKHCLEGTPMSDMAVFFGNVVGGPGTTINAVGFAVHPTGDIGIIKLESDGPCASITPFGGDLATHVGEPVRVVGFGTTSENGPDQFGTKRQGMNHLDHVQDDGLYIGLTASDAWTCYGDSGGPTFMMIGGQEQVVGVTSYGTTICGQPDDVEVRTDTYIDWINTFLPAGGTPDAGPPEMPDAAVPPSSPDAGPGAGPDAAGNPDDGNSSGGCGCAVGHRADVGFGGGAALMLLLGLLASVARGTRRRAGR